MGCGGHAVRHTVCYDFSACYVHGLSLVATRCFEQDARRRSENDTARGKRRRDDGLDTPSCRDVNSEAYLKRVAGMARREQGSEQKDRGGDERRRVRRRRGEYFSGYS